MQFLFVNKQLFHKLRTLFFRVTKPDLPALSLYDAFSIWWSLSIELSLDKQLNTLSQFIVADQRHVMGALLY
jgi:hypothetical protein